MRLERKSGWGTMCRTPGYADAFRCDGSRFTQLVPFLRFAGDAPGDHDPRRFRRLLHLVPGVRMERVGAGGAERPPGLRPGARREPLRSYWPSLLSGLECPGGREESV